MSDTVNIKLNIDDSAMPDGWQEKYKGCPVTIRRVPKNNPNDEDIAILGVGWFFSLIIVSVLGLILAFFGLDLGGQVWFFIFLVVPVILAFIFYCIVTIRSNHIISDEELARKLFPNDSEEETLKIVKEFESGKGDEGIKKKREEILNELKK